jgi:hypothetical protein
LAGALSAMDGAKRGPQERLLPSPANPPRPANPTYPAWKLRYTASKSTSTAPSPTCSPALAR